MDVVLPEWIVADGELAPVTGAVLAGVGLRARCSDVRVSTRTEGAVQALAAVAPHSYELHGVADAARDVHADAGAGRERRVAAEFVLDVGAFRVLASTTLPTTAVVAGARLVVQCTLTVVGGYEWDGFGLPDVRQDWTVRDVRTRADGDLVLDLHALPRQR